MISIKIECEKANDFLKREIYQRMQRVSGLLAAKQMKSEIRVLRGTAYSRLFQLFKGLLLIVNK